MGQKKFLGSEWEPATPLSLVLGLYEGKYEVEPRHMLGHCALDAGLYVICFRRRPSKGRDTSL